MVEDKFTVVNEHIKYKDNFLEKDLIESLYNKLTNEHCPWMIHRSVQESKNIFWNCSLDNSNFFKNEVDSLKTITKEPVIRIYANGQTYSQHGDFHDDDGQETILIGMNKDFDCHDGGGTEFLLQNNCSYVVYPIYNRGIIFNANILHRALPTITKIFRITLAIKTGYNK